MISFFSDLAIKGELVFEEIKVNCKCFVIVAPVVLNVPRAYLDRKKKHFYDSFNTIISSYLYDEIVKLT